MVHACVRIGLAASLGLSGAAFADGIVSFTYSDLDGSFDAGAGMFNAKAGLITSGDVTRLTGDGGTAEFNKGFYGFDLADFTLTLDVTDWTPTDANGKGTFVATDAVGDTISGQVDGMWINGGNGIVFFNGLLSGVVFADNTDTLEFTGSTTGSFSTDFEGPIEPYEGALVQLLISGASEFMTKDFEGVPTLVSALIVPTPGAFMLVFAGGLLAARRRR